MLSLLGARSAEVAAKACGTDLPSSEHASLTAAVAGNEVAIVRSALGVDLLFETSAKRAVWQALLEAGAREVAEPVAELARIEQGLPRYGIDMTEDNLPGEAGIVERAVSFTKGCYVGQEPVARMFHKGHPNRLLRGIELTDAGVSRGQGLFLAEREVGKIGSVGDSPRYGPIALAIVRREAEPGARLTLAGSDITGTVIELPFGGT
jgi:folate-binding protein YgfZ